MKSHLRHKENCLEVVTLEFKGRSHEEFDLLLTSMGRRSKAEEQIEIYPVPYRDDEPSEHTGKYKPYLRPMEFMINDNTKRGQIYQWLDGYGKLRTSKDPNGYFKAEVIQAIDSDKLAGLYDKILVTFKINPGFFYMDSGDTPVVMTVLGTIVNMGTIYSEPLIRIVGTGNITLTINGRVIIFTGIETFVDIDPDITPSVYKNNENQGYKMVGDLPMFDVGPNIITWTGSVTEIDILPRWREL